MKITKETRRGGNPRRGYHNNFSTITFEYNIAEDGYLIQEREEEIIKAILTENWMWFTITQDSVEENEAKDRRTVTYTVRHGYDSGD